MKNKLFFFFCIFVIGISFSLTSCSWAGNDSKGDASTIKNDSGFLLTKTPTDFDVKFGYEVLVYKTSDDSTKIIPIKVFIPKSTWERLPEPDDYVDVNIQYIKSIEYGEGNNPSLIWDKQFNLCIGYIVDSLSIEK